MKQLFRSLFEDFRQRDEGSLSVETVIVFPLLAWAFCAMLIFWDGFSLKSAATTASYTIADVIARQTEEIDHSFIEGTDVLFGQIATRAYDTDVRITVLQHQHGEEEDGSDAFHKVLWSDASGQMEPRTDVQPLMSYLPLMPVGSSVILVETLAKWEPPFVFMGKQEFTNHIFTTPRYVPQIAYKSTGSGNGNSTGNGNGNGGVGNGNGNGNGT